MMEVTVVFHDNSSALLPEVTAFVIEGGKYTATDDDGDVTFEADADAVKYVRYRYL